MGEGEGYQRLMPKELLQEDRYDVLIQDEGGLLHSLHHELNRSRCDFE